MKITICVGLFCLHLATYNPATAQEVKTCVSESHLSVKDGAAIGYLSRVMDQFHNTYDVYTDAGAAGNHFVVRPRMSSQDSACLEGAEKTVPPMNEAWTTGCHAGLTCIKAEFKSAVIRGELNWGAWYFMNGVQRDRRSLIPLRSKCQSLAPSQVLPQEPDAPLIPVPQPNWGNCPDAGVNLEGATKLTFWAKGDKGGERVEFFALGVGWDPDVKPPVVQDDPLTKKAFAHPDLYSKVTVPNGYLELEREWRQYTIDLKRKNLSYVLGGFGWVANAEENGLRPITFYLDDIRYDKARPTEPRFLVSYETSDVTKPFDRAVQNVAYTYDNALALLAFVAAGEKSRAQLIADAFIYAQQHDRYYVPRNDPEHKYVGSLRNAYQGGDLWLPPGWLADGRAATVRMPGRYFNEPSDPPLFRYADVKAPAGFVVRLKAAGTPLDKYLRDLINKDVWRQLENYECAGPDSPELQEILIQELNRLLTTVFIDKSLYDEQSFGGIRLSPYLQSQINEKPKGDALQRLNRLLLQAAYPNELGRITEGWLEDSYSVSLDTGNVAWAMLALLTYHETFEKTKDSKYLEAARQMGEWVARNCYSPSDEGGFTGGFLGWEPKPEQAKYKSTEHNIDLYAAFQRLYRITGDPEWRVRAEHAMNFVMRMWDDKDGKFWTGTRPPIADTKTEINEDVIPLDIQAWAVLALKDEKALSVKQKRRALAYVEEHMKLDKGYDYSRRYSRRSLAYQDREGVWYEGTAQMAAAYKELGDTLKWQSIINLLKRAQLASGGMPASDREAGLRTGFSLPVSGECIRYYKRGHVGATAWMALAERGVNPYWMTGELLH